MSVLRDLHQFRQLHIKQLVTNNRQATNMKIVIRKHLFNPRKAQVEHIGNVLLGEVFFLKQLLQCINQLNDFGHDVLRY